MTKYLSSAPFSSGANSDAFRASIERMFGKKPKRKRRTRKSKRT